MFVYNLIATQSLRASSALLVPFSVEKPAVREFYQRLRNAKFDPWLDEENLLPGQDWENEIKKAVRAGEVVIA